MGARAAACRAPPGLLAPSLRAGPRALLVRLAARPRHGLLQAGLLVQHPLQAGQVELHLRGVCRGERGRQAGTRSKNAAA
jgi:hypothetical protein